MSFASRSRATDTQVPTGLKIWPYSAALSWLFNMGSLTVMEQVRAMTETAADMTEAAEEPQSVSQDSPG